MGEEKLAGRDPLKKIEILAQKVAKMQESGPIDGQLAASLLDLQMDLEELLQSLPRRCSNQCENGILLQVSDDAATSEDSDNQIQKMTRAIEALPSDIVLTDLKGNIEYVNASLLKNSGFRDASELIGLSVFDFTNAEGRAKLHEEIIPTLCSVGRWQGELLVNRADGQSYIAEMICSLIRDGFGNPSCLLANFFNITDRKRAEESLLLDDSRLEALQRLNQMDEASIQEITDYALEAGVKLTGSELGYLSFVDINEETLYMHSWSKNAMQICNVENKKIIYNLHETGLWGEAVRQRRAVITNDYASCSQRRGVPQGHVEIIRHMNVPIMDKGKIVIVAGLGNKKAAYDDSDVRQLTLLMSGMWKIIQRRRTDEALRKTQEGLEKSVAERTAWLLRANEALQEEMVKHRETEMELRSAQQAADAACRAKSEFLANMSHEIRTPMNAVIGLAGLLLETKLTAEQRDLVETIHSSGDALLAIINDILDFSKIDEGKMKLERLPFLLHESIESSLNMVATKAAEKGLDLTYDIDEQIAPTILGDSVRLRQVLANLLSNAVKFTERGSITIHVRPGESEDEIQFSVTDTGIGIGPDDMEKLFQSFSQVDASTSRKYGGTGLGLAISKRLVELMGGRIWVDSKLGEGSTFSFCIDAPSFSGDAAIRHLAGKKVMALLDSESCLRMLLDHARSWGMQIYPVVSSIEARELAVGRFDAAILDLDVPGAEELAEEIDEHLPVISLSKPGRQKAGQKTLIKPFSQEGILFALQEALAPPRHKKIRPASGKTRLSDLSILLAEDNLVNQKVARLMLKKLGCRADLAVNGREVLQAISRKSYDVILMDVQMPEMDGLEATRAILDLNLKKRPKILAMTAYALEGDKERCLLAGMDGYISKPVQLEELRDALSCIRKPACSSSMQSCMQR